MSGSAYRLGDKSRPYARIRKFAWRDHQGNITPGIGIFQGRLPVIHLTFDEALRMADLLVDLAEEA